MWKNNHPDFSKLINYPDGAPKFKKYGGYFYMSGKIIQGNTLEQNRFVSISDFKWCMNCGGEVEFIWNSITYTITHPEGKINISEANRPETEKWCNSADEVLEYMVGKDPTTRCDYESHSDRPYHLMVSFKS
jgi:hypothetical protein